MYGFNIGYDGRSFKPTYPSGGQFTNLDPRIDYFGQLGGGFELVSKNFEYKLYGAYGLGEIVKHLTRYADIGIMRIIAVI